MSIGVKRVLSLFVIVLIVGTGSIVAPGFLVSPAGATSAPTVTQTFGFDSDALQNFTVPPDVTSLTITATGGQGGWGGADSAGSPPPGGYQGQVSGTISVTPGDYLTIGVGAGGDEPYNTACTPGSDDSAPDDPFDAAAGVNPLTQYDGGMGGAPGSNGCSGYGGAGGAATAVEVGSSVSAPTSVGTIVAGGGGGDGGSGQYILVQGQIGLASYVPQTTPTPITYAIPAGCTTSCSYNTIESPTALSVDPTQGQPGIAVFTMCGGDTTGNDADQFFSTSAPDNEAGCDGGGGAGGGGGAAGGSAGNDEFGSGQSDEWYGQGGSPGENSTGGLPGLSAIDAYYADTDTGAPSGSDTFADPGAEFDGSVTITYSTGVSAVPTAVAGTPGNGSLAVQWDAPSSPGAAPISDYVVQYSSDGGTLWVTDDTGSTAPSATISGLTNGTGYIVEVEAVNSIGDGPFSLPSGTLTPTGPPGAPTITSLTPQDGALQVQFTPSSSGAPFTGYLYQLDGSGTWFATTSASNPLIISGLTDGTSYSVELEAVNGSGTGAPSNAESQTPVAVPGAPTVTSVQVGPNSASVAFTPGSDGGATITGYQYSTDGGGSWAPASTVSPLSVTGLANGSNFSLELEAGNGSGFGAPTTTTFTTSSVPAAPVISWVTSQNQALSVTFTAPASNGSPITDYEWSTDGGVSWYSEATFGTPCQSGPGSPETCQIAALSTDGTTPLANGTTYPVEVRALNAVGTGSASSPQSGTPSTTPGAPAITTGASGMIPADQTLTVSFTAPTDNGGSVVTGYQYSTDSGATWLDRTDGQSATDTTMTISDLSSDGSTPLDNGTTYRVEIRAENAAGDGPGSAVAIGIPAYVPDAPTITAVLPENGALAVAFTPGSNGGAAITSYRYSTDGGSNWTITGSLSSSFVIGGLTDGASYPVTVQAVNQQGDSVSSAAVTGTPATVPAQPFITTTTRGNQSITVAFSTSSAGGSPIVSYQYSTDGGATWSTATATSSPVVITTVSSDGVTAVANGTNYPVEVRAVNIIGDSLASSSVNVAPAAAPGAPTVTLTPGNGVIAVGVTVPDDGGSPVSGIDYSLNSGPFVSTGTTGSSFTIPGLTNGSTDSVSVRADNAIGPGTPSAPADATPITVPGAPVAVIATTDSESADISWAAPASNGGSPITGYTATAYTSTVGTTTAGTACTTATSACTVTGLTDGTTYYVGVVATNAAGPSPVSNPLQSVTPIALPGAPTLTGVTAGDSYLSVSFTDGTPGGDPISSYQYSLDGGTTWISAAATTSPLLINGLVDGTSYTVSMRAVSAAGPGATSTNSQTGTPATYPETADASTVVAAGQNGQIAVSWTVPADGGSPVTQAQATAFSQSSGGTQEGTCTTNTDLAVGDTTSCTITHLINGTTYYVSTQSDNAVNWSSRSTPFVAATPSIPSSISSTAFGDGEVGVAYNATPSVSGTNGPYAWSVTNGSLPTGLAIDPITGTVSGQPTASGPFPFTLVATDTLGGTSTQSEAVEIAAAPAVGVSAVPDGEVNVPYSAAPTVSGGTGPYAWAVTTGSLPTGLAIDSTTGAITGTPSVAGPYTFTVRVTDNDGQIANQGITLVIATGPSVATASLPGGQVGTLYNESVAGAGGTGPYTWAITAGSLPSGLVIDSSTGAITGTPSVAGPYTFTVRVTDNDGQTASAGYAVAVVPPPAPPIAALSLTTTSLPDAEVGMAYGQSLSGTGGTTPYRWSISAGTLPAGLGLGRIAGTVSGTPSASGQDSFTVTLTDANGLTASKGYTLEVVAASASPGAPPSITTTSLPDGSDGSTYAVTPDGSGGTGPYTWSVTNGSLPTGLTMSAATGAITGTVSSGATSETFTVSMTDADGHTTSQVMTLVVGSSSLNSRLIAATPDGKGYWVVGQNGTVMAFGDAVLYGSAVHMKLDGPIVGIAATPDGKGYWLVASDGGVFTFGDAGFYGSAVQIRLNQPVLGMVATPDGRGYWLLAYDGGVFSFGDAAFYGSAAPLRLNKPIVGFGATPDGKGYWLVASDGGVFTFGDAAFYGSAAPLRLNQPIVGLAATPDGEGYWLVASDGGVFTFGDAAFHGSAIALTLNEPLTGIQATPDGNGYWLSGADGGVFSYGRRGLLRSGHRPAHAGGSISDVSSSPTSGSSALAELGAVGSGDDSGQCSVKGFEFRDLHAELCHHGGRDRQCLLA